MSKTSSIDRSRSLIAHYFDAQPRRVYRFSQLTSILWQERTAWRLAATTTTEKLLSKLLAWGDIKEVPFPPFVQRPLYVWRDASPYELASEIFPKGYLTHASALYTHGLTNEIPKTIYVNHEQSAKPKRPVPKITQEDVDAAFAKPQRESGKFVLYQGHRIVAVNGKFTGQLEVIQATAPDSAPVRVTGLERTLIDCVVRPAYAGGIHNTFEAFKSAKDKLSSNVLRATLERLDYRFPYHQSIGFLLERAGYLERSWKLFAEPKPKLNFYLVYAGKNLSYDERWKLFFPEGLV